MTETKKLNTFKCSKFSLFKKNHFKALRSDIQASMVGCNPTLNKLSSAYNQLDPNKKNALKR